MPSACRSKDTVLVVEDDEISRELLAQVLQTGGFDVIATSTGERALLTLCQQGDEIDWLVSKVRLPGLVCGWLLADEYHTHHPDRAALLVSPELTSAKMPSVHAVFIPPATPMKVLDILKALRAPEAARARTSSSSQAASPAIFHQRPGERGLQTDLGAIYPNARPKPLMCNKALAQGIPGLGAASDQPRGSDPLGGGVLRVHPNLLQ